MDKNSGNMKNTGSKNEGVKRPQNQTLTAAVLSAEDENANKLKNPDDEQGDRTSERNNLEVGDDDEEMDDLVARVQRMRVNVQGRTRTTTYEPYSEDEEEDDDDDEREPFFVHIDIRGRNDIGPRVNSYMLRQYAFDPRKLHQFYDTLFDHRPTLSEMRTVGQNSQGYYELWKVKSDFSIQDFFNHFQGNLSRWGGGYSIHVCKISNNEHENLSCYF
jgi:hypothetical protein